MSDMTRIVAAMGGGDTLLDAKVLIERRQARYGPVWPRSSLYRTTAEKPGWSPGSSARVRYRCFYRTPRPPARTWTRRAGIAPGMASTRVIWRPEPRAAEEVLSTL